MAAVSRAEDLLERLGAIGERARRMARYPLHPRLARLVIDAVERGAGEEGCRAAAVLSSGRAVAFLRSDEPRRFAVRSRHPAAFRADSPHRTSSKTGKRTIRNALALAILTAFPDRVARRRKDNELLLASGGSAVLECETRADFLVAIDIEDRSEHALPLVRLYCAIEPAWLLDLFPDRVTERAGVEWNRSAERVEAVSALLYENLVIEETRSGAPDPEQAAALLAERALEAGIERFVDRRRTGSIPGPHRVRVRARADPEARCRSRVPRTLPRPEELRRAEERRASLISTLEQRAGAKLLNRNRAQPHSPAQRPPDQSQLRNRQAALDRLALAGFLRAARNAAHRERQSPAGGASARPQQASGADHHRSRRFLAAPLSASAPRTEPPLSQACLAGRSVLVLD